MKSSMAVREISTVLILGYVIGLAIHEYQKPRLRPSSLSVGEPLSLGSGLSFPNGVVIAVSEVCPYSRTSIEFHKEVIQCAHRAGLAVAILASQGSSGLDQLAGALHYGDRIAKLDLERARITGTPTILLVQNGLVSSRWTGLLSPAQQKAALSRMDGVQHVLRRIKDKHEAAGEYVQFTATNRPETLQSAYILDIRSRDQRYSLSSLKGAIQIPGDELAARMQIEIPASASAIVIDCSVVEETACISSAALLNYGGFQSVWLYDPGSMGATCASTPTWRR
jgi:hypothetical protein